MESNQSPTYTDVPIGDGLCRAYVELPQKLPAPAVVILHEVFGINDDMRDSSREFAALGYVAICPELFWRQARGVELNHKVDADFRRGLELYGAYDRDQGEQDIATVIDWARGLPAVSGKVGVIGYCLGGLMTLLVAARSGSDGAVAYYPGQAELYVDEAIDVRTPLIVHLAGEDDFMNAAARAAIRDAFAANPNVEVFTYEGQNHAFARHSGLHFNAFAALLANNRTEDFFKAQLTGTES